MEVRRLPSATGLLLVVLCVVVGLAWGECMVSAIGGVLAYRLLLLRIDRGVPWPAMNAALDALAVGALAAIVGLVLLLMVGLAWWGWWQPSAPHPWLSLTLLGVAAPGCSLARNCPSGARAELLTWIWLFAGVLLALSLHRAGWSAAPCALTASVGIVMVWAGCRLAAVTGLAGFRAATDGSQIEDVPHHD